MIRALHLSGTVPPEVGFDSQVRFRFNHKILPEVESMDADRESIQSVMCGAIAGTSGMTHIDFQQCETIVFSEKYCVIAGAYTLSKAGNDRWTIIELAYTVAFEKKLVILVEIFCLKSEVKKRRFIVKQGDKVIFVLLSDVLYIESMRNDLLWHCTDGIYKERVT